MKTIINKILPLFLALTSLFLISVKSQFKNLTESVSAPWQMYFHDPETPIMEEGIINFHDKAMCLITFIVFAVGYVIFRCVVLFENKKDNRLSEKFIHGTAGRAILPALVFLNLGVPSLVLLEGAKGNPSQGAIVKVVTQDSPFIGTNYSSGFLPELTNFLVVNKSFILTLSLYLGYWYYITSKPKPPSGPGSGSEGGSPTGSESGSEGGLPVGSESGPEGGLPVGSESGSEGGLPAGPFSGENLGNGVNSPNFMFNENSFPYDSEAFGEEVKSSTLEDPYSSSSSGDVEPNTGLWWDKLCSLLDEDISEEERSSLIRELLENPDSLDQVRLIGELIDSYRSSNILWGDSVEGLTHAFTFCNAYYRNNSFLENDIVFVEAFTNSFLVLPPIF